MPRGGEQAACGIRAAALPVMAGSLLEQAAYRRGGSHDPRVRRCLQAALTAVAIKSMAAAHATSHGLPPRRPRSARLASGALLARGAWTWRPAHHSALQLV